MLEEDESASMQDGERTHGLDPVLRNTATPVVVTTVEGGIDLL